MIPTTQTVRDLFMASHRQVMRITLNGSALSDRVYAVLSDDTETELNALALSDSTEYGTADTAWALFRGYLVDTADPIEITESDILVGGFSLDSYSVSGERIEIGSAIASELTLNLQNFEGTFDAVRFEGAEMFVELGVKDWSTDDAVSWIPLGYFTADKQPKTRANVAVTALDRMVWFDQDVDWSIFTFPCTLQSMVETVCSTVGITLATDFSTLPNADYSVTYSPETVVTYRNIIQWAGFLTGTCARIDENGELVFKWYEDSGLTINAANRYSHELEEDDITPTGIYFNASGVEYLAGTADYALEVYGCDILQNNVEAALANVWNAVSGISYRPFEAVIQSAPFLQPLDTVSFVDRYDNTHTCIITHVTYTGNQSTPIKGVGETATTASYANLSGLTAQQSQIVDDARRQATNYLSQDETGIMVANMTDGQRYTPSNVPSGVKNTFIDDDSFDVRDGTDTLASFGTESQLGPDDSYHQNMNPTGYALYAPGDTAENGDTPLMRVGYIDPEISTQTPGTYYDFGTRYNDQIGDGSCIIGESLHAPRDRQVAVGRYNKASDGYTEIGPYDATSSDPYITFSVADETTTFESFLISGVASGDAPAGSWSITDETVTVNVFTYLSLAGDEVTNIYVRIYHIEDTLEFAVGNGSDGNRSNAFEVYDDGTARLYLEDTEDLYTAITAMGWESEVLT